MTSGTVHSMCALGPVNVIWQILEGPLWLLCFCALHAPIAKAAAAINGALLIDSLAEGLMMTETTRRM